VEPWVEDLDAEGIILYLRANGWELERRDARRSIWRHSSGARVFVPGSPSSDSRELLRVAFQEIAQAEDRTHEELAIDLAWQQFDKLHLHREASAGGLLLADGLDLHIALRDAIVAAARASSEPRSSFSGRRPLAVEAYIDRVRLIPAVPGSFVVRALLPLDAPPEQEPLALIGVVSPKVRRIATTLLRASAEVVETAQAVAQGAPPSKWDDSVPFGVSANLCDALTRLTGSLDEPGGGDAQLRIAWSWVAPEEPSPTVTIPRGLAPIIAAGADFLRGEPEEHTIRIVGLVTKLHREEASGPGEVTVRGHIESWDASSRAVRLELDERTYRAALAAHDAGLSVKSTALVRRTDRGLTVVRVEDFHVLE